MKKILFFLLPIFILAYSSINQKILFIKTLKLAEQGYDKEALKNINTLLKFDPDNPNYLVLKGSILKDMKRLEEAKIILKKALEIDPDNLKARKLIKDIEQIENMSENDVVKKALSWLNDKGIDLLFMFLGVLGGELLIAAFSECKKEQKKEIKDYVFGIINKNDLIQKFKYWLSNVMCYFINLLIIMTLALVFTIVVIFVLLLINPSFMDLQSLTFDKFWKISFIIYFCLFLIILAIFYLKNKKKKITSEDVALILMKVYASKEFDKLKEELVEISKLPKQKQEEIFDKIVFDDAKEKIMKFYKSIKDKG